MHFGGMIKVTPARGSRSHLGLLSLLALAGLAANGCKKSSDPAAALTSTGAAIDETETPPPAIWKTEKLLATAMQTNVYAKPSDSSKKVGYLRLGAIVARSDKSYGTEGCPGGWYGVAPRGYVCVGKTASLEVDSPL